MRTTITAAAVVGMSTFAHAEPTLRLFGDPYDEFIQAFSISADGKVPGGYYQSLTGTAAGLWTSRDGAVSMPGPLFDPKEPGGANVLALSADGRIAAVYRVSPEGITTCRWSDDGSLLELGDLGGDVAVGTAGRSVSFDGAFIAGGSMSPTGYQAFIWSPDTGITGLGVIEVNPSGSAFSEGVWVSDDGSRVRGISTTADGLAVFEWSNDLGMTAVSSPMARGPALASASPDGSALTGVTRPLDSSAGGSLSPFLWVEGHGFKTLPAIPGDIGFVPYGVSNSGHVVVGNMGVWTPDEGFRTMRDVISESFDPSWLTWGFDPNAVSADGNTITGIAFIELPEGWIQIGFLYTFDNPCPADLNRDGRADFFDLADFLRAFTTGDLFADENLDGRLDFFDIQQYLNALAGGCP